MLDNFLTCINGADITKDVDGCYSGEYWQYEINEGDELTVSMITGIPYMYLMDETLAIFKRIYKNMNGCSYFFVTADYEKSELHVMDQNGLNRLVSLFVGLHSKCPFISEYLYEVECRVTNKSYLIGKHYNGLSFIK